MLQTDIRQMDYTQLRQRAYQLNEELEELKGEFSRWKREISDMLENLDESNFSSHIRKQRDKMMAQLTITPEQIRSAVCKGIDLGHAIQIQFDPAIDENKENSEKLDKDKIYLYNGNYYYYDQLLKEWKATTNDTIYSLCEQRPDGFYLKGNVIIDGSTVQLRNITPLRVQYSAKGTDNWHDTYSKDSDFYMRLSTDGGQTWGEAIKITAGDTTVTDQMIFETLTNHGDNQGVFSAFTKGANEKGENKLFINASYINAGTLSGNYIKGGTVSGTSFTDAKNIATLVLGYTSQSSKQYANLKLVRNADNLMMFGIEDNSGSGTTSASIFVCGRSIGWGDANAFNPNGKWNFSSATILNAKITGANISGTQLNFAGDDATADFSNAKSVKFNGANVDFTKANVTGLEGYYVFSE